MSRLCLQIIWWWYLRDYPIRNLDRYLKQHWSTDDNQIHKRHWLSLYIISAPSHICFHFFDLVFQFWLVHFMASITQRDSFTNHSFKKSVLIVDTNLRNHDFHNNNHDQPNTLHRCLVRHFESEVLSEKRTIDSCFPDRT